LYPIFRIHLDLGCFSKLYSGDYVYFHNLSIRFRLANYLFETTELAKIFIQVFPYDAMENQTELFGQSNTMHTPPIPPFPIQSQAFIQDGLGCFPVQELSWVYVNVGSEPE